MKYRVSIRRLALVCAVVLVGGFAIGYLVTYEKNPEKLQRPDDVTEMAEENNAQQPSDDAIMDYASEPTTTYDTRLIFKSFYSQCGHTVVERQDIPARMVGVDEHQMHGLYPDWEVEKFGRDEVILYRRREGACPEHYILKVENGYVAIYRTVDEGETEIVEVTDIPVSILRLKDQERLRQGMLLDNIEEVNQYLEDLGS